MKCSLVEFSATALDGETTRAFLLFIPKFRRKRVNLFGIRAKSVFYTKNSPNGEEKFQKTAKRLRKRLDKKRGMW